MADVSLRRSGGLADSILYDLDALKDLIIINGNNSPNESSRSLSNYTNIELKEDSISQSLNQVLLQSVRYYLEGIVLTTIGISGIFGKRIRWQCNNHSLKSTKCIQFNGFSQFLNDTYKTILSITLTFYASYYTISQINCLCFLHFMLSNFSRNYLQQIVSKRPSSYKRKIIFMVCAKTSHLTIQEKSFFTSAVFG